MIETGGRRRGRRARADAPAARRPNYRRLSHPFTPQHVFPDEAVARMHDRALWVLETLGVKILLPEARALLKGAGARVEEEAQMVFLGREIVEAAIASAPTRFRLRAADPQAEQMFEPGAMLFAAGSGCPNASDRERGRRAGRLVDFEAAVKLIHGFDVIHVLGPNVEPQDVPIHLRHYAMTKSQLMLAEKPMFVFGRGRRQTEDCFEMIRLGLALTEAEFTGDVWATTIVNTNSPRQIDSPMAEALIDFARAGQLSVVTPFCLAGAMAPVTVAGALVLQHAEALAAITLAQTAKAGAPVAYGGFSSNVDMKSGAPAFGTPAHIQLLIGTGQLARHVGLPWRGATGAASNAPDMQAAGETHMGLWGALMANATLTLHAAGWLEGGLTFGFEKFINDVEALQMLAEICVAPPAADEEAFALDALAEVAPGGHFFAAAHTMARFDQAFYEPLVADLRNFGTWEGGGATPADARATAIWKERLAAYQPPPEGAARGERVAAFIDRRTAEGGAPPSGG